MEIHVSQEEGYAFARLSGAIDELASDPFRSELHPLFANRGTKLVIDLSDCDRINSRGIGNLVVLVSDAHTRSCRVVLASPSTFVKSVFEVTKLNTYFTVADGMAHAVELLEG